MSSKQENELRDLVRKRGVLKGKVTLFAKYVQSFSASASSESYIDLGLRLDRLCTVLADFEAVQDRIEATCSDYEAQLGERESFENAYYSCISLAKKYMATVKVDPPNLQQTKPSHSCEAIKFPDIKLPTFSGDVTKWLEFRDTFDALINQSDLKPIQKLKYLRSSLTDGALNVVASLEFCEESYLIAWRLLCERYNNTKVLVNNHLRELFNIDTVRQTPTALRELVDNISRNLRTLNNLNVSTENWDVLIVFLLSSKLDKSLQHKWEEKTNSRELPTLQDFKTFLRSRADLLESLGTDKSNSQTNGVRRSMVVTSPHVQGNNAGRVAQNGKASNCLLCKETHFLGNCSKFLVLNVPSRIRTVKRLGLCINCLGPNHILRNCRSTNCRICKGKHHTRLHLPTSSSNNSYKSSAETQPQLKSTLYDTTSTYQTNRGDSTILDEPNQLTNASINLYANHTCRNTTLNSDTLHYHKTVILTTALVNVIDSNNQLHTLRALLDSGSQSNFIVETAFNRLNLQKRPVNLEVLGFNSNVTQINHTCKVSIQSRTEPFRTKLSFFIVPMICKLPRLNVKDINHFRVPRQYQLADSSFYLGGDVDMILGSEIFYDLLCKGQYRLGIGLPTLQETRLGWVATGSFQAASLSKTIMCKLVQNNYTSLTKDFWASDEATDTTDLPDDDKVQAEKIFQNHTRNSDGKFVVDIPLKEPVSALGQSRHVVYGRFKTLESKFQRDPTYKAAYVRFMREFEQSGHMVRKTSNEICNYLPHHAVVNLQKTTTPLRVVIDASFKTSSGKSLNDIQYKGAVNQDKLVEIILRFRKHKFVVSADIEKMYRMIYINPNQSNLQCILWRENPDQPLHTYALTTLSFGLKSAPYIATRCLLQLANENHSQYPKAATVISSDFYMDDLLHGGDDEQEVAKTAVQVSQILEGASFHLRKWKSNSTTILNQVSDTHVHSTLPNMITQDVFKVLGLQWCSRSDNFIYTFKQVAIPNNLTKRKVLSIASAIFDPIGLLAPVLVIAKLFIQELWQIKSNWDDKLPNDLCKRWETFHKSLVVLNSLKIPRHTLISNFVSVELHGFADSSISAYGSAIYLRSIDNCGNIMVRLLCAKSRVARKETIPRLELRAARLLADLTSKTRDVLKLKFTKIYLWSDSSVALAWIRSQLDKLKPFIKNRVRDIQTLTKQDEWHWIPSSDNPADLLSRGVPADKFSDTKLWWTGPSWLSYPDTEWPPQIIQQKPLVNNETLCNVCTEMQGNEFINNLYHKWSKLDTLIRVFAYVLRFILRSRNIDKAITMPLSVDELNRSLYKLIMFAQMESFPVDYQLLIKKQPIRRTSKVICLNPFMQDGLIRVGGRLGNSPYTFDKKHPILLHNKHILTKLILQSYHAKLFHAGPQLLLASVRERYWPINGKGLATKTVRECVTCFRANPRITTPTMGEMPASRVTPALPFTTTGVDYAGPFTVRSWRGRGYKTSKSYIALFVCFVTKAIHIELVSGLETQTFLAAFRRFVARRGKPSHVVSDNGTTFKGANNQLLELYQLLNDSADEIITSSANEGIKWSFQPAYTPHMGGLFEAAVKSCKYFLKRILGQALLTYEEFMTVLVQVEGILNSRPLCPLFHTDVHDYSVLTPAHFLIGRSITGLPDNDYKEVPVHRLTHFQQLQQLQQNFWRRWSREYVGILQQRTKWRSCKGPSLGVGTMVLVKDERLPPCQWRLGRIIQAHEGSDGLTRVATVQTTKGPIRRAFNNICPLPITVD